MKKSITGHVGTCICLAASFAAGIATIVLTLCMMGYQLELISAGLKTFEQWMTVEGYRNLRTWSLAIAVFAAAVAVLATLFWMIENVIEKIHEGKAAE